MTDREKDTDASDYRAKPDEHIDSQSGERVPTPDPKDQTGDPEADNPAMRELHKRQRQGDVTES
jgi:hypothetical protein